LRAGRGHPAGAVAASVPRILLSWAHREWKLGEAAAAKRLCEEALALDPTNDYVLVQLGSIEAEAGQVGACVRVYMCARMCVCASV
jgi:hypothetical protein